MLQTLLNKSGKVEYYIFRSAHNDPATFANPLLDRIRQDSPDTRCVNYSYFKQDAGMPVTDRVCLNKDSLVELLRRYEREGKVSDEGANPSHRIPDDFNSPRLLESTQQPELCIWSQTSGNRYVVYTTIGLQDDTNSFYYDCARFKAWLLKGWKGTVIRFFTPRKFRSGLKEAARTAVEFVSPRKEQPYFMTVERRFVDL